MKYLLEVDKKLYGYNSPCILRCDILLKSVEDTKITIYELDENSLVTKYNEIDVAKLRAASEEYINSLTA